MTTIHILMVESDAEYARVAKQTLEGSDLVCVVHIAPLLAQALKTLKLRWYNLVLLNLDLPDSSGLETLQSITSAWPRTSVVAIVGPQYEHTMAAVLKGGATDCLIKSGLAKAQLVETVKARAITQTLQRPHFKQQQQPKSKRRPKK
jgi:DNA-binding NtrC family response regulator